ncbi:MAG: BatD family protein [Epsilonproteobacteria bacterium]|nr:BatD family protein [Campylobacterota bacterium]
MKTTLGRVTLLLMGFFFLLLHAEDFNYTIAVNKQDVYLKEPVLLSVDLNQTNPDTILLFHFQINPSKDYKIVQLQAKYDDTFHHLKHHNLYEIFPLHTGDINVTFSLVKRVTDIDKVRYFSSGDRDDFKKLETSDSLISLPAVELHVKPLPKEVKLVGDFTLDYTIDSHTVKAFSPVSWKVTLKGKGYPPLIKDLIPTSPDYKTFTEKPLVNTISTPEGMINRVSYLFALSAQKSYTLPTITIKAFSPTTHKTYMLNIPKQHFEVQSVDKTTLVDSYDSPAPRHIDWSWLLTAFKYLFVFFVGYFTAYALRWKRKNVQKNDHPLVEKIDEANTEKKLLQVLMSHEEGKHFATVIEKLEASLYGENKTPLKTLKKEALKKIK